MRSTQFHDVTAEELEKTWRFADATPRVDAPRLHRRITEHKQQLTNINHVKRYRAARKAKASAKALAPAK